MYARKLSRLAGLVFVLAALFGGVAATTIVAQHEAGGPSATIAVASPNLGGGGDTVWA